MGDMRVTKETSQECSKQLEMKTGDMTAKNQQLASLADNVNALTEEKNKMVEQVIQLQAALAQVNVDKDALAAEKNSLANDLEALKASISDKAPKEAPKEDAPNPETPKEEAPIEEAKNNEVPEEEAAKAPADTHVHRSG